METLRLHPALPLLVPRETMRRITVSGYDVPAKTRVLVNAWAIGRDPASWDDPEEFVPERFEGEEAAAASFFNRAQFEFLPFGAGRRMCPGIDMGVATTEFTLANLLYCFDWELPEGVRREDMCMEEAGGLTVHKKTPLLLVPTRYNHIDIGAVA
jgi:4-hydroxyphenylacetaldehyde oxime monooxygenase